jgi:hypothetical protein
MASRRVLLLGLAVTALVVVAGVASRGRPLAGSRAGAGPTASFFDYGFTTIVILGIAVAAFVVWNLMTIRGDTRPPRARNSYISTLAMIIGFLLLGLALRHSHFIQQLTDRGSVIGGKQHPGAPKPGTNPAGSRGAHLRWDEILLVVVVLAGMAAYAFARRTRRRTPSPAGDRSTHAAVSSALDESLDDLRNDPDLRRAIIAAYARMETAFGLAGIPRRPSEAPTEYMERALTAVDASAPAAHRLTVLFEWAKFSQHEPGPEMRDEAIDALVAVRDELREPAEAVAA